MALTRDHRTGLILILAATLAYSTAGRFPRAINEAVLTVIFRGRFGTLGLMTVLYGLQGRASFANLGQAG